MSTSLNFSSSLSPEFQNVSLETKHFKTQELSSPTSSLKDIQQGQMSLEETVYNLMAKHQKEHQKEQYFKSLSPQHLDENNGGEDNSKEEKSYDKQREELLNLLTKGHGYSKTSQKSFPLEILKKSIDTAYTYLSPLRYLSSIFVTTQQHMTLPLYGGENSVQWNDEKPHHALEDHETMSSVDISLNPISLSRSIPCHLMENIKGVRSWMETHCLKDLLEEENKELFLGQGKDAKKPQGLLRRDLEENKDLVVEFNGEDLPAGKSERNALLLNCLNKAMDLPGRYNTNNTCWIIHRRFVNLLRNLTLSNGFAWTYEKDGTETLFGRPVYIVDLPIKGFYGVFGDMEQSYANIRHENFYLLVNPYSNAPHTNIHMRYSLGGGILDSKAYTMIVHKDTFTESLETIDNKDSE